MNEVSDDVLLEYIKNTRKEAKAYRDLWMANQALSELPENDPNKFYLEINKYQELEKLCLEFLKKLESIRDDRGL